MAYNHELNIEVLRDLPKSSKIILKGVEDHHDVICANAVLMHQAMSPLLGPLMYQGAKGMKLKNNLVKDAMVSVLRHLLAVCEACEYDLPEQEELIEWTGDISYVVENDSVLTLSDMMMSALDIMHVVHVDLEGMTIWSEEAPSEELVNDIKSIIVGIRNLGKKHNFTLRDVISEL